MYSLFSGVWIPLPTLPVQVVFCVPKAPWGMVAKKLGIGTGQKTGKIALSTAVIVVRRSCSFSAGRASLSLEPYHLHLLLRLIFPSLRSNKILKYIYVWEKQNLFEMRRTH